MALCHSGLSAEPRQGLEENAAWYLTEVPGINAVVTGHQHKVFPGPDFVGLPAADSAKGTIHGIPVVMPGFWGSHLGVIDLTLYHTRMANGRSPMAVASVTADL